MNRTVICPVVLALRFSTIAGLRVAGLEIYPGEISGPNIPAQSPVCGKGRGYLPGTGHADPIEPHRGKGPGSGASDRFLRLGVGYFGQITPIRLGRRARDVVCGRSDCSRPYRTNASELTITRLGVSGFKTARGAYGRLRNPYAAEAIPAINRARLKSTTTYVQACHLCAHLTFAFP
jgi:hypothetical protein